jgi:hypothetical protein
MILLYSLAAMAGATPTVPAHAYTRTVVDTDSVLTVDALTRMTTFWASLKKKKEDVVLRKDESVENRKSKLWYGSEHFVDARAYSLMDMVVIAAKYPSVAVHLQQAGLTAKQWDDYDTALWSALLTDESLEHAPDGVVPTAVQVANIRFLKDHLKEFNALRATGMWYEYNGLMFGPKTVAALSHYP